MANQNMPVIVDKQFLIALLYYSLQTERSFHKLILSSMQWQAFLEFFDFDRRRQIAALADRLDANRMFAEGPGRECLKDPVWVSALWPIRWVSNRFRTEWRIPSSRAAFAAKTLRKVLSILKQEKPPTQEELLDMRMDLYGCYYIARRMLTGIPVAQRLFHVEHFNQSEFVTPITAAELGIGPLSRAP